MTDNWGVYVNPSYVEVLPIEDDKDHYAGDECWCNPKVIKVPGGQPPIMVVHEAHDGRE